MLLFDHAAGNPRARVAGGVGLVVVPHGMNHERRAAVMEQRIGAEAERHVWYGEIDLRFSAGIHVEVRQIAGVSPHRIILAVLLVSGIEMPSRRGERRTFTLTHGVDVQGVRARRQIGKVRVDFHATFDGTQIGRSDLGALSVSDDRVCLFGHGLSESAMAKYKGHA